MSAAPLVEKTGARLIAVAKERLGHEEFVSDHWNVDGGQRDKWLLAESSQTTTALPLANVPELFFDTWTGGSLPGANPLFRVANGESMKWTGVLSYLVGGAVSVSNTRVNSKEIKGNYEGEGTILGAVLIVSKHGEVLFHHKEQSWGDHPSDEDLIAAISKLSVEPENSAL